MSQDVDIKRREDVKVQVEADNPPPPPQAFLGMTGKNKTVRGTGDIMGTEASRRNSSKDRRKPRRPHRKNGTPGEREARLERGSDHKRSKRQNETPEVGRASRGLIREARVGSHVLEEDLTDDEDTDEELREEVKQILIEKRDKWKQRRVTWTETPDGLLLMSRAEMIRVKARHKEFIATKKREEKMSEEELAKRKQQKSFSQYVAWAHMTEEEKKERKTKHYFQKQARMASLSAEEREHVLQKQRERVRRSLQNATEEQKQRHKENVRKAIRRHQQKNKEKYREYQRSMLERQTPEQRQRRLLGYKISQAKRLLRRKLEKAGVPPEEIQEQVDQLVEKIRSEPLPPLDQVSEYKPMPRKRQRPQCLLDGAASKSSAVNLVEQPLPSTLPVSKSGLVIMQNCDIVEDEAAERDLNDDDDYDPPSIPSPTPSAASPLPVQFDSELSTSIDDHDLIEFEQHNFPSSSVDIEETEKQPETRDPHSTEVKTATPPPAVPVTTSMCFKCPKCFTIVPTSQELAEHLKSHQSSSVVGVKVEDIEISKNSNRSRRPGRRKATHVLIKTCPFSCMKCPLRPRSSKTSQFETHDKLTEHVQVSHPKDFFPCPQCKLLKYNSFSLKIHLKICWKRLNS